MKVRKQRILTIQTEVLDWYATNKRDLPWRRTRDPYAILVSEIMLQQTQVSRVIPKYEAFLREFPTVQKLAGASPAAVIRAWKGLGYNRRALNLLRAARIVVSDYRGQFPSDPAVLIQLPGIGRYTAGAVATFAFGAVTPAVDTNVKQFLDGLILARTRRKEADYYDLARQLIPADRPGEWLHALMDFVALQPEIFAKKKPRHSTGRPSAEPFIGSNRYLRGQVLDRLRDQPETPAVLFRRVARPVMVPPDRLSAILKALVKDGLIESKGKRYQLTES